MARQKQRKTGNPKPQTDRVQKKKSTAGKSSAADSTKSPSRRRREKPKPQATARPSGSAGRVQKKSSGARAKRADTSVHKSPPANRTVRSPPQDRGGDDGEDHFREVNVGKRLQAKWKPIKQTSIEFIDYIFDQTITNVLNSTSSMNYNVIQDHLNALKLRCDRRLRSAKAPATALGDYKTLGKTATLLEEQVTKADVQLDRLQQELEMEEKLKDKQEDELENSRLRFNSSSLTGKIHPLLDKDSEDVLGLPSLPTVNKHLKSTDKEDNSLHLVKSLKLSTNDKLQDLVKTAANLAEKL